jgi:endoglucanase Acf2
MVQTKKGGEREPLSAPPLRPQYNYFYGSTTDSAADALTVTTNDTESLVGEILVPTDNEDETLNTIEQISNGHSTQSWFHGSRHGEKNGIGRVLVILLLAASVSTFFILLIPHTSRPIPEAQSIFVPFDKVNRADYGDPVEGFLNFDLFHPSLLSDDEQRAFNFPFPTGAFWTNLVVPSSDPKYSYPIVVYPYAYKWSETSLQLSYPAAHRLEDKKHHWITDSFAPELTINTAEAIKSRFVTRYDPLSVTIRFVATTGSKWETTLVQGSPYTTIKYLNGTPTFKALTTFKSVQCPGDEAEDFHDFFVEDDDDDEYTRRRQLFGVCSIEVRLFVQMQKSLPYVAGRLNFFS